jgi:hypothetical protein
MTMLLGRDLVVYTATVQRINFVLYLLTLGLVAAAGWRLRDGHRTVPAGKSTTTD